MKHERVEREEIFKYVENKFGTEPEYLWIKSPDYAVLRNTRNSKWYAVIMNVQRQKLGLEGKDYIDILDVKCDPIMVGSLLNSKGYLPAYHMNKSNWITILLDGSTSKDEVFSLIDLSYEITRKKR